MKKAWAVVGAQFGDEGKGLVTDALAAELGGEDVLVVRCNGGGQAGHTVHRAGHTHVFHHLGSGTLTGAATHWGPAFVANPMFIEHEWRALVAMGQHPRLSADPQTHITLPFDILINQAIERARGRDRHGSCGMGFGESVERQAQGFGLTLADARTCDGVARLWHRVRHDHVPARLARLGLSENELMPWLDHADLLPRFLQDVAWLLEHVRVEACPRLPTGGVVFEGAQGLRLDQDHAFFPHVTRSSTGLPLVLAQSQRWGIDDLNPVYVSRCYVTRHGAGPLPHAWPGPPVPALQDPTNMPNPHQGSLRFAPLCWTDLMAEIQHDLGHASSWPVQPATLVLTNFDRAEGEQCWLADSPTRGSIEACLDPFLSTWSGPLGLCRGPSAQDLAWPL